MLMLRKLRQRRQLKNPWSNKPPHPVIKLPSKIRSKHAPTLSPPRPSPILEFAAYAAGVSLTSSLRICWTSLENKGGRHAIR